MRGLLLALVLVGLVGLSLGGASLQAASSPLSPATTQTFSATADTTVFSGARTVNYGSSTTLSIGFITGDTTGNYRALMRFDLSAIPTGSTVNSARLILYTEGTPVSMVLLARRVTAPWTEGGATWDNQPGSTTPEADRAVGTGAGFYAWDVQELVQGWVAGTYPNHGILLRAQDEGQVGRKTFLSSEAPPPSRDFPDRVRLEVDWTAPTPTRTVAPGRTATLTPTPMATATRTPTRTATPTDRPIVIPPSLTPTATLPIIVNPASPTPTPTLPVIVNPPSPTPTSTLPIFTNPTPVPVDIKIYEVEITQGIQNFPNEMPHIKDRRTYVRAHAYSTLRDSPNVRARLRGFRDGAELPGSPRQAEELVDLTQSAGSRRNVHDSFWFYVPKAWRSGQVTFRVEVNYDQAIEESDYGNNTWTQVQTFFPADPANIVFVPLHLHQNGDTDNAALPYYTDEPDFTSIYKDVLRRHPISTINTWVRQGTLKPVCHDWPCYNTWDLRQDKDRSDVLERMAWMDFWTADPAENTHYMGMVHPLINSGTSLGKGRRPGKVAWTKMRSDQGEVSTWYVVGGMTMGHELGHNKGLKHINCSGDESGGGEVDNSYPWPFPNCRLAAAGDSGYFGFDVYYDVWDLWWPTVISNNPNVAAPNRGFPMMGYQEPQWVSPWEFCKLMPQYGVSCNLDFSNKTAQEKLEDSVLREPLRFANADKLRALLQGTEYIAAGGLINTRLDQAEFTEVVQVTNPTMEQRLDAGRRLGYQVAFGLRQTVPYTLVQVDAAGNVLASHDILLATNDGDSAYQDFFELVPLAPGTVAVQVRRGSVLVERRVSGQKPQVQLLSPNGGESVTPGAVVRWTASDPDGDALSFTLLYSVDDGQTWQLVEQDVRENRWTAPSAGTLPGSEQARLRVIANDGFWSAQDDSDAAFSVPNTPPKARIASPDNGKVVDYGKLVVLTGAGMDIEDGPLPEERLVWRSSLDGELGTGEEVAVERLSLGVHDITLMVTDSQGQTSVATTRVIVAQRDHRLFLPHIQKIGEP